LLDEKAIPYRYREYTRETLTEGEIRGELGAMRSLTAHPRPGSEVTSETGFPTAAGSLRHPPF
jgi:hypothetical protein